MASPARSAPWLRSLRRKATAAELCGPSVSTVEPGLLAVCAWKTRHQPTALRRRAALRFMLTVTEAARDWICVGASSRSELISAELAVSRLNATGRDSVLWEELTGASSVSPGAPPRSGALADGNSSRSFISSCSSEKLLFMIYEPALPKSYLYLCSCNSSPHRGRLSVFSPFPAAVQLTVNLNIC